MEKKFTHIFWMITEQEIDLVNVLLHIIEKHDDILEPPEVESTLELNRCITTNMHDISAMLGNKELNITNIMSSLDLISKNLATIYYDIEDGRQMEKGAFLNKYKVTSSKNDVNKRITLWINTDLIKVLQDNTHLFNILYKQAKYELKSKYSIILYDYFLNKGDNKLILGIDEVIELIDYDLTVTTDWDWSRLNSNVLKRAIKEINNKTDLHIVYDKVKTSAGGRKQTTQIEFEYYQAKDDAEDEIFEYFSQSVLSIRRLDYYIEKHVHDVLATMTRFKDANAIKNPEAYMAKIRREALRDRDEFEAKIRVQEWSNVIKYEHTAEDGLVGLIDYTTDDGVVHDFVTVNNDYKLYDPQSKVELSTSARDTYSRIEDYFQGGNKGYTIYSMPHIKNCSISYSKG